MRLVIQRSPDPVPYRGAYFRISPPEEAPARASVVLGPAGDADADREALALLLGLAIALGEGRPGGAPISQHWLTDALAFEGKMGSELAPRHDEEARRVAVRVGAEWERFLGSALARLAGEARGDAHFRFAPEGWSPDAPAAIVAAWPPLEGEVLPPLE